MRARSLWSRSVQGCLACASTVVALLSVGAATASASPLSWAAPVFVDHAAPFPSPNFNLKGVSCPSTTLCVAVDDQGNAVVSTDPTVATPTWSPPADMDGANDLVDVSCSSASLCAAVDIAGNAVISTDPTADVWSAPAAVDGTTHHLLAVSCASTSLCVAVGENGSAAISTDPTATTPTWSAAQDIDGSNYLEAVSCPSTSLCVAVDTGGNAVISTDPTAPTPIWTITNVDGMVTGLYGVSCLSTSLCVAVDESGRAVISTDPAAATPTWSTPADIDGTNFIKSVSCPSTSLCVAIDTGGNAMISTDPTAVTPTWSTPAAIDGTFQDISGVSCFSTSLCVASQGGGGGATPAGVVISTDPTAVTPTWSTPADVDGWDVLTGVSCPSTSLCAAVDGAGHAVVSTDPTAGAPTWSAPTQIDSNGLEGVSCVYPSLCVAVDFSGEAVISTDPTAATPTWSAPKDIDGSNNLRAVSCPSTSLCVAVDGSGNAVISTDPTAPTSTWSASKIDGTNFLDGVSCPSISLCVAVDFDGHAVISTNPTAATPTWSTPADIDGTTALDEVSCASASQCVAVDAQGQALTSTDPTAATPTWTAAVDIDGTNSLAEVSCSSASLCVAVDDAGQAVISTDPTGPTPTWSVPADIDSGGANDLIGVSCFSTSTSTFTSLCVAVDREGYVVVGQGSGITSVPVNSSRPTISGIATVGQSLSCSQGVWFNSPTGYTYQWNRDGTAIGGATNVTYTVQAADQTHSLTCTVTASNAGGAGTPAQSVSVAIPGSPVTTPLPVNTAVPTISGIARVGQSLSCSQGAWSNSPTGYTYQWNRDGTPIGGATNVTYTVQAADQTHSLTCTVTASNAGGAGTPAQSASVSIPGSPPVTRALPVTTALPVNTAVPVINGEAKAGKGLSCSQGSWTQSPTGFAYGWSLSGTPIQGASKPTYTVQTIDEQLTLTCTVTASNPVGASKPATSEGVKVAVPHVKGCPAATGRLDGTTLGLVTLGMTRTQARAKYKQSSDRGKKFEDFFCLTPIGVRVGYASPKLVDTLPKAKRARFKDRVIWASTSSAFYTLEGVRAGATITAASRTLRIGKPFHIGKNLWYLVPNGSWTAVLKVRQGVVEEIGIGEKALTTGHKTQVSFLHSFS
jgi:hypothetical protein